ncbi:MAG: hypothetical protein JXB10_00025 [Pirellulales bacterium]|nr:hypothetical protein [Pirellulales bacterium]
MKRIVTAAVAFSVLTLFALAFPQVIHAADAVVKADASAKTNTSAKAAAPAPRPADRVIVMYFHRTQRCPTCLRMGSYSEEAVRKGFAREVKSGAVEFHYVDFQDKKNAALTKGYKIGGPSLIVVKVMKNKAVEARNLTEIWSKNRDKDVFLKYVQDSVAAFQKSKAKTAMKPEVDRSAQKTK